MKKIRKILLCLLLVMLTGCFNKLPKPEKTDGLRGEFGIDKNINEETIDKYLNRKDTVYRDMRMLIDVAEYENIGGDSYLSGFVKGFEVVPYPLLAPTNNLPEEVNGGYEGETLFSISEDGKYVPNYVESFEILEYYFPKDKNIFLMCDGGGYASMTKDLLVSLGWDADKIYNVGGYWYYNGSNNVVVKKEINGEVSYDFWKVTYHDINFKNLHKLNEENN